MENERKVFFTSDTTIDWDSYKYLSRLKYKKVNKPLLIGIIAIALCCAGLFLLKELSAVICFMLFLVSFLMILSGYRFKKTATAMQGQQKIRLGKDVVDHHIEFADRIYVTSTCDLERVYEYALVESVYETEENFILMLSYNVPLFVDKHTLTGDENTGFADFILSKCYELKKRKVIRLKDGKKNYDRLTVLAVFLSVVVLMLFFFQETPENWRELGRNPLYSSSQQSTTDVSSDSSK